MMNNRFFSKLSNILLDLIFPKKCLFCSRTVENFGSVAVCPKCSALKPVPKIVRGDGFMFDEAVGILKYEGPVRSAMIKYKFNSVKYYGKAFAECIMKTAEQLPYLRDAVMCCVPISPSRDRAYNQTELIASELAAGLSGISLASDLLYKAKDISPLSKMNIAERRLNIRGAFGVNPEYDICGKNIIVVDDIYTSGTTAQECARALKACGAQRVYIVCACYD